MILGTGPLIRGKGASGGRSESVAANESLVSWIWEAGGRGASSAWRETAFGSALREFSMAAVEAGAGAVASMPSSQRQLE